MLAVNLFQVNSDGRSVIAVGGWSNPPVRRPLLAGPRGPPARMSRDEISLALDTGRGFQRIGCQRTSPPRFAGLHNDQLSGVTQQGM